VSTAALATTAATDVLVGCGWRLGTPPDRGSPAVTGASVEPGARMALARGAAGHDLSLELLGVEMVPQAVGPTGTAAWTSRVAARAGTRERPGCAGEITAERVWVATDPETAWTARSEAVAAAAEELARRAADAVVAVSACRP
jgi:hypothetical protein